MVNLREKVYRMFVLGTEGGGYKNALKNGLGGVIFFTKDIQSVAQIKKLTDECIGIAKFPPFISIDQEGGRVERTENIHNGKKYLSAKFAFEKGILKEQTENIALELKELGFNLNFAPCIDVNTNPNNPIIGERAFSSDVRDVIEAGKIVSETYLQNGIIPCVKHYPGHGDANADSHLTLPEIDLPLSEMEKTHIAPFKSAVENGIRIIMAAHLHCKCFDRNIVPASLSKNALDYLRNKLTFDGIIISDDMVMQGVASHYSPLEACLNGIKAGLNMFIYRNSAPETIDTIEQIVRVAEQEKALREKIELSYQKIQSTVESCLHKTSF